jgi:hypothetical protein
MPGQQEQPGIGGHQRLIKAETQAGAARQLRVDELRD